MTSPMVAGLHSPVKFDEADYWALHGLFAQERKYAGYRPNLVEIPNGDGKKDLDESKRFLHVATKYDPPEFAKRILFAAHGAATEVARALNLPDHLFPSLEHSAMRVLEYVPGSGTEPHTDFNLFTLNLWRSHPVSTLAAHDVAGYRVHFGELAELFGVAPADEHSVPSASMHQYSLVYFALPRHSVELPPAHEDPCKYEHAVCTACLCRPNTVGQWLQERIARSRSYK